MAFGTYIPKFVPEAALIVLLLEFRSYTYGRHETRYPYEIPIISSSLLGPLKANNCCTFVEALLVKTWQNFLEFYPHMKLGRLNVEHINWVVSGG